MVLWSYNQPNIHQRSFDISVWVQWTVTIVMASMPPEVSPGLFAELKKRFPEVPDDVVRQVMNEVGDGHIWDSNLTKSHLSVSFISFT